MRGLLRVLKDLALSSPTPGADPKQAEDEAEGGAECGMTKQQFLDRLDRMIARKGVEGGKCGSNSR